MIRKALGAGFRAAVASMLLLAAAGTAHATFDVSERGTTITVTQLDTTKLTVVANFGGGIVVNDGVSVVGYPLAANLVVRGADALTPSQLSIVIHEPLPGSLTLDLPGASDVTVSGTVTKIKGSLKVNGGDAAQILRLGDSSQAFVVEGSVKLDMRGGNDQLLVANSATILGSFTAKGVNALKADVLEVGGSLSVNVKRDSDGITLTGVTRQGIAAFVGRSLSVISGPGTDYIQVGGGAVGKNATFKLGDGVDRQTLYVQGSTIGGSLVMEAGKSSYCGLLFGSRVKKSVKMKSDASFTNGFIYGPVDGSSIQYLGGDGIHSLEMQSAAPNAIATIKLGSAADRLYLFGDEGLALKRLDADLGEGNDDFSNYGFVLPPGSTIKGLP